MSGLLVLGAGRHQAPLIARAEERGVRTIALDYYEHSPGKAIASESVLADALDIAAVRRAATHHDIDAVATVGTDQAVIVVATVAEELGLPCHISAAGALTATNKVHMRTALDAAGVPMTDGADFCARPTAEQLDGLPMPCVVKAADSQGQRGMQRIEHVADLPDAIEAALVHSRSQRVVVEAFAEGPELTINAWMRDGEPVFLVPVDRHTFNPPPALGICVRHVAPSIHRHRRDEFVDIATRVARGFGISDGPLYIQVLVTDGGFRIVEAASRVGGGHEAQLFDEMYGLDLLDLTIDTAFGRNDRALPPLAADRAGLVNFVVAHPGRVHTLSPMRTLVADGRIEQGWWYIGPGYEQSRIVDSMGRIGAFIVTGTSHDEIIGRADEAYAQLAADDNTGANLVFWPDEAQLNVAR